MVRGAATDSTPLPGAWVVLHEVRLDGGGPLDSLQAAAGGRFRFTVARPDTTALYMVSTTYRSLTYFSEVATGRDSSATFAPLVVYDTSSTGPTVTVAQRHIVVRGGGAGGPRSVLELVALANDGDVTRIAGDPARPTWIGRLPGGASGFTVGQGDVSAEAVTALGDSIVVTAPVPPGVKQLVYTYELPGERELRLPLDQPAERLLVLLEDTTATLVDGPLTRRGVQVFNDAQFVMYDGTALAAGGAIVFRFEPAGIGASTLTIIVVGTAALLLLLAVPLLQRRTPGAAVAPPPETPEALARAIALLDAAHEGRSDRTPAAEEQYRARRAALKAQLNAVLARRRDGP